MRKKLLVLKNSPALAWLKCVARVTALSLIFSIVSVLCFGQAQLLVDANANEALTENEYQSFKAAGGNLYFKSRGMELWRTTGTTGGTSLLKAFTSITAMQSSGSTLYFFANDGVHGLELWKSNGTVSGTVMVKDITPGATGTVLESLVASSAGIYFTATTLAGKEVWKSNGTSSGTIIVKDIVPGNGGSDPSYLTFSGSYLYFTAYDGTYGWELWKSDGTAAGTALVKDIAAGGESSSPERLIDVNGTLYFTAQLAGAGRELWKSNGTADGTVMLEDIMLGEGSSGVENMINVNGTLFFTANDGELGYELWKTDGEPGGTTIVKDMTPGFAGSHGDTEYDYFAEPMGNFYTANGLLYYTAYRNNVLKIWRSDGTDSGTVPIQDAQPLGWNHTLPVFAYISNTIYYFNVLRDEETYDEHYWLWKLLPGTTTPIPVKEFTLGEDPYYGPSLEQEMVTFNNTLFFNRIVGNGYRLFKSHGTAETTTVVKDVFYETQSSDPVFFGTTTNQSFFLAAQSLDEINSGYHSALWRTDGTPGGTRSVYWGESLAPLLTLNNTTFFTAQNQGFSIYKTDGTEAGTRLIDENNEAGYITGSAVANNVMFLNTWRGRLWRSDGTATGTLQLRAFPRILRMYTTANLAFVMIMNANNQIELWRSNGAASGTYRVKNFNSNGGRSVWARQQSADLNGVLYFIANDQVHGAEVWRSDGTATGTYMFADLNSSDLNLMGSYDFDIASLYTYENALYISALDNDGKWKLYKSDGISAPQPIVDMFPVSRMVGGDGKLMLFATDSHTYPQAITQRVFLWAGDGTPESFTQLSDVAFREFLEHKVTNGVMYFHGPAGQLWRSDGTSCGTYQVQTGVLGAYSMQVLNNQLLFSAFMVRVNAEPFAFNLSLDVPEPCESAMALTYAASGAEGEEQSAFRAFPNPFANDFVIDVIEPGDAATTIQVFTSYGSLVETIHEGTSGIALGQSWKPGMYIVKVTKGAKVATRMIVKK